MTTSVSVSVGTTEPATDGPYVSSKVGVAVGVALVLLVLAVGGYFYYRRKYNTREVVKQLCLQGQNVL